MHTHHEYLSRHQHSKYESTLDLPGEMEYTQFIVKLRIRNEPFDDLVASIFQRLLDHFHPPLDWWVRFHESIPVDYPDSEGSSLDAVDMVCSPGEFDDFGI